MSEIKDSEVLPLEEDEETGAEDENENDDEVLDVFSCKYCDYQSTNIDELDDHIISHDEAILEDNFDEEVETNNYSKSTLSPFTIADSQDTESSDKSIKRIKQDLPAFYDEFKNKTDKRVFVCPYCGYQSMKKLDMNKHLKVHSAPVEVPVYACAECPYSTRRKCDMPKHLLTHCKDGSVTMYKCNYCLYQTKRKGDLPKHMLCHRKPEFDELYRCHQCNYTSRRRGDLKKHQFSHESDLDGIRDNYLYNCTECGYTSKRLNDLHKHVVLHCDKTVTGIFKCPKCTYASEVGSRFARHVLSNCRNVNMGVSIFPQDDAMQDYIVLDEDELHLYQLDKTSVASVEMLAKDFQDIKHSRKRKRSKDEDFVTSEHSDIDSYYVEDNEELDENELLEDVDEHSQGNKVLVLAGYEDNKKVDGQDS